MLCMNIFSLLFDLCYSNSLQNVTSLICILLIPYEIAHIYKNIPMFIKGGEGTALPYSIGIIPYIIGIIDSNE